VVYIDTHKVGIMAEIQHMDGFIIVPTCDNRSVWSSGGMITGKEDS
jgi:hypothetical protein